MSNLTQPTELTVVFRVDPNDVEFDTGVSPLTVTETVDGRPLVILFDLVRPKPERLGEAVLRLLRATHVDST